MSQILNTVDDIVFLAVDLDSVSFEGFSVDGQGNGQLSAGLIQINACSNFRVRDVEIKNAGTVGAHSPNGVNGLSIATDAYPSGEKSSGIIDSCVFRNCTKAPLNWTTYAEKGVIANSEFYDSVGNSQTPAMQINGGRDFKMVSNRVERTEGAGVLIAAVGTTPGYAGRSIESMNNTFIDIGSLGEINDAKYAYVIADGFSTGEVGSIKISNDVLTGCENGFMRSISGIDDITVDSCNIKNTTGAFDLTDVTNSEFNNNNITDFNVRNISSAYAYFLRDCSDISVSGGIVKSINDVTPGVLLGANSGLSTGIRINNVELYGVTRIMNSNEVEFFEDTEIEVNLNKTAIASINTDIQLLAIPDGRTVSFECECYAADGAVFSNQKIQGIANAVAGTATLIQNSFVFDTKAGIATGLFFDITGSNTMRLRYLNNHTSDMDLKMKIKIKM
ncbi:MAG: hypothetical protein P8J14_01480 [Emcibacteraceae bacterium]|nr:hypothetical protein [Emcibacteraceae bacterium]